MHARVTRFEGSPTDVDKGIKLIKEQIVPSAKKMGGLKHGYWMVDRKSGKGVAITFFENEGSMRASEGSAEDARKQAGDAGSRVTGVDRFEVIAEL
jgi:hypothetical protein